MSTELFVFHAPFFYFVYFATETFTQALSIMILKRSRRNTCLPQSAQQIKKNMSEKLCGLQSDALINNVILFHFIYSI